MARDDSTVLRVEHLTMRFGGLVAVDDLSFEMKRGTIAALIGPNGAGKTTVFNCITGFYRPTEGRLTLQHGDPARCFCSSACLTIWWRSTRALPAHSRTSACSPA
jgi:ABC-type branched-subunit amino acid transport system ATPase component